MAVMLDQVSIDGRNVVVTGKLDEEGINLILNKNKNPDCPKITNVIFNNPATIVFFSDGGKSVVTCEEGEKFSPWNGVAMAVVKYLIANNSGDKLHRIMDKWAKKYNENAPVKKRKLHYPELPLSF